MSDRPAWSPGSADPPCQLEGYGQLPGAWWPFHRHGKQWSPLITRESWARVHVRLKLGGRYGWKSGYTTYEHQSRQLALWLGFNRDTLLMLLPRFLAFCRISLSLPRWNMISVDVLLSMTEKAGTFLISWIGEMERQGQDFLQVRSSMASESPKRGKVDPPPGQ